MIRGADRRKVQKRFPLTRSDIPAAGRVCEPAETIARDLMRPVLTLPASTPVHGALRVMRNTRTHLVIVTDDDTPAGLLTLNDVLHRLLPTTTPG